jgi:hypothetical protein
VFVFVSFWRFVGWNYVLYIQLLWCFNIMFLFLALSVWRFLVRINMLYTIMLWSPNCVFVFLSRRRVLVRNHMYAFPRCSLVQFMSVRWFLIRFYMYAFHRRYATIWMYVGGKYGGRKMSTSRGTMFATTLAWLDREKWRTL